MIMDIVVVTGQAYEYMIIGQQSSEDNILIGFQLNTVVNSHNWMEDMAFEVNQLRPVRWKVIFLKIVKSVSMFRFSNALPSMQKIVDQTLSVRLNHSW